ncbi:MAG: acetyl-CoA carboxylase biotin carboxyl carrier protein [Planctomycetes bacterium]|nr:acetyl-CoA carboxylase biotin carboxyl carrier protein [Planctomycetota bacterium]
MDHKEIKQLIKLMERHGLAKLEIEEGGHRCLLEKASPQGATMPMASAFGMGTAHSVGLAGPAAPLAGAASVARAEGTVTFNSPMVGTYFSCSSPELPPFIKVGDRVDADTTLCLIEAMKVFNEIKAERSGIIVEVLAENHEAVEYNQPLFLIRPL